MYNAESEQPKGNILIVDDLLENLRLLSELLNQQGYKVRSATNGKMALKTVRAKPPDLILLDIKMPEMDGYEVCEALKKDKLTAEIPVIFLSASDELFDKVKAFKNGGIDYITKPFQIEEVIVRIENQLTIQRQKILLQKEISERKQTQEILYQSRALLKGVLNSSLDGVAAFQAVRDRQGHISDFEWIVVNAVTHETLGVSQDQLVGKLLLDYVPGMKEDGMFDSYVSVVERGEVINQEYHYEYDSFKGWFQIVAVKLGDGFVLTFRDINERKKMELALQAANQELERLVNVDGLTGVSNRRRFNEYINQEWQSGLREKQPLSLIMCDVDYFKLYNDREGHLAGDQCLTKIAQAMNQAVKRPRDLLARYGGEEFGVILPNTSKKGALQVAKELQEAVKDIQVPHPASAVSPYVSLSLGVSSVIPNQNLKFEMLIAAADDGLYEAKKQGRDRFVFSNERLLSHPEKSDLTSH